MDMKDYLAQADARDAQLRDMAVTHLLETEPKMAVLKAMHWAVSRGIQLVDVFFDFNNYNPGTAEIGAYINTAMIRERHGEICYLRDASGKPVICIQSADTLRDNEVPRYHTIDDTLETFDDFRQAYEAYEAQWENKPTI